MFLTLQIACKKPSQRPTQDQHQQKKTHHYYDSVTHMHVTMPHNAGHTYTQDRQPPCFCRVNVLLQEAWPLPPTHSPKQNSSRSGNETTTVALLEREYLSRGEPGIDISFVRTT